jgi:Kef-type K+ transport system membrane component KefB
MTMSPSEAFGHILFAIAVVVIAARLVGLLVRRLGQPQVMGEIVAGIVLGPSVLGAISGDAQDWLFPSGILPTLNVLAQLGLIFFMFLVGLELDPALMRGRGRTVGYVLPLSLALPFCLGVAIGVGVHGTLAPGIEASSFALFLGTALAITAFPVLARLLAERNLTRTPVGAISLTCAAIEDVCAWLILAVVVALVKASGPEDTLLTLLYTALFAAGMLLLVRPALAWVVARWHRGPTLGAGLLTLLLAGVLLSAYATDRIGIHSIFGAFLFGVILPRRSELVEEVTLKLEDFTLLLFLPIFFAITGLQTELGTIDSATVAGIALLVLAAAVAGKFVAGLGGGLLSGMPGRDATVLGLLLNTRGLTELVIISIGKDLGVVPDSLFAILVVMALVTTFMAAPLISLVRRVPAPTFRPSQLGLVPGRPTPQRILAALDGSAGDEHLAELAVRLAEPTGARVTLARVLPEPERLSRRTSTWSAQEAEARATSHLAALAAAHRAPGVREATRVATVQDVGLGVCREVEREEADLCLIGWNRALLGVNVLGGAVGTVLERCAADVAVLVDQTSRGLALERGESVLVPYGSGSHDGAALQLAARFAAASGAPLEVLAQDEAAADRARAAGVEAERIRVVDGSPREAIAREIDGAGLLVIGAGEDWALQRQSFGRSRARLVAGVLRPVLVVRRGDASGSEEVEAWLRRARGSGLGDWLATRAGAVGVPER